jgi:hypothetical protein
MSLTMSSSFCDKTFSTAATDSGRAGSLLLNLVGIVDMLDLHQVVLEAGIVISFLLYSSLTPLVDVP